jgi:hypothetical protein
MLVCTPATRGLAGPCGNTNDLTPVTLIVRFELAHSLFGCAFFISHPALKFCAPFGR